MSEDNELEEVPTQDVIDRLKQQFPNRTLSRFVIKDQGDEHVFILTSPNREEWKKYRVECKSSGEDIERMEIAVERAALAQIRWPEREEVKALFASKPGIIANFAGELNDLVGTNAEVSSKKL